MNQNLVGKGGQKNKNGEQIVRLKLIYIKNNIKRKYTTHTEVEKFSDWKSKIKWHAPYKKYFLNTKTQRMKVRG